MDKGPIEQYRQTKPQGYKRTRQAIHSEYQSTMTCFILSGSTSTRRSRRNHRTPQSVTSSSSQGDESSSDWTFGRVLTVGAKAGDSLCPVCVCVGRGNMLIF